MATSKISVSEGSGKNLATYSFSEDATTKEAQRIVICDSSGTPITTDAIGSNVYLRQSMIQDIEISAGNSSTTNIASGANFTGTSQSNLGINAIQINFRADQICTIQLQQSPDGTNWDYVDEYRIQASVSDVRTLPAKGSYCRVVVTNNGASSTTVFRLQTTLAPIMSALNNFGTTLTAPPDKCTYRACSSAAFIPTASVIGSIKGSSTKTVKISKIGVMYTCATGSANYLDLSVTKLSALTTPGTRAAVTIAPIDSLCPAATALVEQYTATSSGMTSVGTLDVRRITQTTPSATLLSQPAIEWFYGDLNYGATPITLRGTSQWVAINITGTLATTPLAYVWFEWTEE